jgi:uncharacterized membrane protein
MKVICPDHQGVVEVNGAPYTNVQNVVIEDLVVECPVCDEEVIINGNFNYDENGNPTTRR